MAWRFAPSKFKNTAPKLPKKDETIYDLPIGNLTSTNNAIHANSHLIAFLIDSEGGKIGVLPLNSRGRKLHNDLNILYAHGDSINDFCFLKFNSFIATCAGNGEKLKIWDCGELEDENNIVTTSKPKSAISIGSEDSKKILDCLSPHKTAENLLAVGLAASAPAVVDLSSERTVFSLNSEISRSLSIDWSEDGTQLLVSTDKGKRGLIFDSRASLNPIYEINLHSGIGKENRVLFTNNNVVSSGFTTNRIQEILLYDIRNWSQPVQNELFENSTSLLLPLFDEDSKLLFLLGKGACKFFLSELNTSKQTFSRLHEQQLVDQTLGACLLPKTACNVMSGEVQRIYQLTKSSIVPISCIVPRRSYQEFHNDLFPDTVGSDAGCSVEEWLLGSNNLPQKVALNPQNTYLNKTNTKSITPKSSVHYQDVFVSQSANCNKVNLQKIDLNQKDVKNNENNTHLIEKRQELDNVFTSQSSTVVIGKTSESDNTQTNAPKIFAQDSLNKEKKNLIAKTTRPKSCVVGTTLSKFRHVEVIAGANKNVFTNLRNVNNRLPTESNGFCISEKYAAIPLSGSAGLVAIFELKNAIKVPDGVIDGIQNCSKIIDLQWNPFRNDELTIALEDGNINIWRICSEILCIGSDAFIEMLNKQKEEGESNANYSKLINKTPYKIVNVGKGNRITCIKYHSTINDLLAIGFLNGIIELWDISLSKKIFQLQGHSQGILSLAWSTNGKKLASVGRDSFVKIYEPLKTQDCCVAEIQFLESSRAARVLFVCNDSLILLTGFSRNSNRQCYLFLAHNLQYLHTETIDVNTQPLIPYYDYDTSVLFLTGKGDRTIHMFEICTDLPYFLRLSPATYLLGHQAIALYQKNVCDVKNVEFACGWRLTEKVLEKLSFKVPRVKKEYFQRDIFPDALITWQPSSSIEDWTSGVLNSLKFINLCPKDMQENITNNNNNSGSKVQNDCLIDQRNSKNQKSFNSVDENINDFSNISKMAFYENNNLKAKLESQWSAQIPKYEGELEQNMKEGVDKKEWIDVVY